MLPISTSGGAGAVGRKTAAHSTEVTCFVTHGVMLIRNPHLGQWGEDNFPWKVGERELAQKKKGEENEEEVMATRSPGAVVEGHHYFPPVIHFLLSHLLPHLCLAFANTLTSHRLR